MKRIQIPLLIIFPIIFLTACGANGFYQLMLVTEGEHILENISGDLILLGGEVTLPDDVTLDGSIHILSGSMNVNGYVAGDVSFLNGDLTLGPFARISGNLNLGGGNYHASENVVIEGRVNTGTGISLPNLPEQTASTGLMRLLRVLISGLLLGSIAAVLARYTPRATQRVGEAATQHGLISGAVGLLVALVGISLLVTMAYTILLIPFTLLGLFVLGMSVLYGWISLGILAGNFGGRFLKRASNPSAAGFFGTLFFILVLELITTIPWIGGVLGIAFSLVGLGAVSLTRFGLKRFEPATYENLIN